MSAIAGRICAGAASRTTWRSSSDQGRLASGAPFVFGCSVISRRDFCPCTHVPPPTRIGSTKQSSHNFRSGVRARPLPYREYERRGRGLAVPMARPGSVLGSRGIAGSLHGCELDDPKIPFIAPRQLTPLIDQELLEGPLKPIDYLDGDGIENLFRRGSGSKVAKAIVKSIPN